MYVIVHHLYFQILSSDGVRHVVYTFLNVNFVLHFFIYKENTWISSIIKLIKSNLKGR